MKATLIAHSQPTEEFAALLDKSDANMQDIIAYCARVSNPSNQLNYATSDKLLNYLLDHAHFSPFEMVSATIEIETTRDIARQLLRHASLRFQEFSQRYADVNSLGDEAFVLREARMQDFTNRQNSIETDDETISDEWKQRQQEVIDLVTKNYNWAIDKGIAKEQARAILPEGNTKSRLYVHGTLRSFYHYAFVRCEKSTQKEHRELATAMAKALEKEFPFITRAIQSEIS